MALTLESLEKRLAELEQEVAALRRSITLDPHETPAQRAERMWRQSRAEQPALAVIADQVLREMGIPPGPPTMTPEELQKQMIAEGVRPEDNAASREIIRMREE